VAPDVLADADDPAEGDLMSDALRYRAEPATLTRWGVMDLAHGRWVLDWEQHSFPTSKGIAEHRAHYLNCNEKASDT
jgi:hypothetical protein